MFVPNGNIPSKRFPDPQKFLTKLLRIFMNYAKPLSKTNVYLSSFVLLTTKRNLTLSRGFQFAFNGFYDKYCMHFTGILWSRANVKREKNTLKAL